MNMGSSHRREDTRRIIATVVVAWASSVLAGDCPYVANEHDEDCYGTLLGPTDWLRHGMVFGVLHRDEWWWGRSEHFYAVSGATFVRIEVYGDDGTWPDVGDREWLAKRTAKAWAAMPENLRRASMPLTIIWEKLSGNPVYYDQRSTGRSRNAVVFTGDWANAATREFSAGFEEGLAHELCHAVDARDGRHNAGVWGYWSESGPWGEAMEADDASVSDYADSEVVEDFAETCAAWFSTSLDAARRDGLAEALPNRIGQLEKLFDRFGTVSLDAVAL